MATKSSDSKKAAVTVDRRRRKETATSYESKAAERKWNDEEWKIEQIHHNSARDGDIGGAQEITRPVELIPLEV